MKEIRILAVLFLSCTVLTYSQETDQAQKVDAPFRLLRGVVLKNDFRMTASIPVKVVFISTDGDKAINPRNSYQNGITDNRSLDSTILLGRPIIIDGIVINDKSQVLSSVQFPLSGSSGANRF